MERLRKHALLLFACLFLTGVASGGVFDHDGDGDVDLDDFGGFFACVAGPGVGASPSCAALCTCSRGVRLPAEVQR